MSGVRCYRMSSSSEDPTRLLTEEGQWTEPWGASQDGARCEKCGGEGRVLHECWSCLLSGAQEECPACSGAVRWQARCPVCRGDGAIDGRPRHGVSVFPTVEGLYHYMLTRRPHLEDCVVLKLQARLADDVDFDADEGALLVIPSAILARLPVDGALAQRLRTGSAGLVRGCRW
jgi:hypothetical protein